MTTTSRSCLVCLPQTECPGFALKWHAPPSLQVAEQVGMVSYEGMRGGGQAVSPARGRSVLEGEVADKLFFRTLENGSVETKTMRCVPPTSTMNPTYHSQRSAPSCEDCQVEPAVCVFLHLRGTEHSLCASCYLAADHEDDYPRKRICARQRIQTAPQQFNSVIPRLSSPSSQVTMSSLPTIAAAMSASIIDHGRRVHVQDQPWSVLDLVSEFAPDNTGTIVVPDDQREWAWIHKTGLKKQEQLVDSVFYGFPIPSLILNKTSRTRFEVYDGRHRIETLWRYFNNHFKWNGRLYSELCEEDKRIFRERTIPTTITQNATNGQLADMFIRLNSGAPLKDYDLLWARRSSRLVSATRRLVCQNARLSNALGGQDLSYRPDLSNWVGLVAGLSSWNAGNMTTSFVRLSGDTSLGLDREVREENVIVGLNALCSLLEAANTAYPVLPKEQKTLKKIGKLAAFFLHEWIEADEAAQPAVHAKWVSMIGRLRGSTEVRKAALAALSTTGAQNLTASRISDTLAQVNAYLAHGIATTGVDEGSDSDSDSDSE